MKVLIVEDDMDTATLVKAGLMAASHTVDVAIDGADGSFLGRSYEYDAIVLDYSLPKKNGLAVVREIRASGKMTPIIFLSMTGDPETKVAALDMGADDYITKPFSISELSARLRALSRRPAAPTSRIIKVHDVVIDLDKHTIERGGNPIHLTRKEYGLLEYLMKNAGMVISRSLLLEHSWTAESDPFSNTVEAHIRNLRKKLNAGRKPNRISNVPGRGYVIDSPEKLRKT